MKITFDVKIGDIGMLNDCFICTTSEYDGADGGSESVGMGKTPNDAITDWLDCNEIDDWLDGKSETDE